MLRLSLLILGLSFSQLSFAWGHLGHSVVGEIAWRNLSAEKQALVKKVLINQTLAEASTWPDVQRSNPNFHNTYIDRWHFTTEGSAPGTFVLSSNADLDIIGAIDIMLKILRGDLTSYEAKQKNPSGPRVIIGKTEALKFLAHFVGDIHQPLHVGNPADYGGNNCLVKWFGEAMRNGKEFWNLHMLWDEGMLHNLMTSRTDLSDDLMAALKPGLSADYRRQLTPQAWAVEVATLRPSVYPQLIPSNPISELLQPYCTKYVEARTPDTNTDPLRNNVIDFANIGSKRDRILADREVPNLDYAYQYNEMPVLREQLLKAGVRLAALIEANLKE